MGTRIIIDIGSNLPAKIEGEKVDIEDITKDCDGVFVTHYHGDHVGEFDRVDPDATIYMGHIAHEIFYNLQKFLRSESIDKVRKFETFKEKDEIIVGKEKDITVRPFRVDHSAYDAYMFLIEVDDKKILHTGDFRTHGWTGAGVAKMLKKYVGKVDVLICEGTMLSRQSDKRLTEKALSLKAVEYFKENKNVFVLCSSTNIDSIASFYKAARLTGKLVIADVYARSNLDIAAKTEKTSLYDMKYVKVITHKNKEEVLKQADERENGFCMFVRAKGRVGKWFKEIMDSYNEKLLIYSMWDGYIEEEHRDDEIYDFIPRDKNGELSYVYLHTSGHAYEEAIIEVCEITNPDIILPIHSENPGRFADIKVEHPNEIHGEIRRFKKSGDCVEI
jgi:ribonuclease J